MAKKKKTKWINDALSGKKGALRTMAKRKGILTPKHDKLTKKDLKKLEDMGGVTAKRAHLAETLMDFNKEQGGELNEGGLSEKVVEEIKEATELKKDIIEDISKIVLKDGTEIESEELKELIANDFKMDVQTDEELVHKFLEGGEIHTHQLKEIIGRDPKHREQVGNTKLQKCFCRHKYRKLN